jgi:hypothetical protein
MSVAVYLLSIPLARHRSIVPRRREPGVAGVTSQVPQLEQHLRAGTNLIAEYPPHASTFQRIDSR